MSSSWLLSTPYGYYIANDGSSVFSSSGDGIYMFTLRKYKVTFASKGGSVVPLQKVNYGEQATKPTSPSKTGYTFAGWYQDESGTGDEFSFDMAIKGDLTLYAKWIPVKYEAALTGSDKDIDAPIKKAGALGKTNILIDKEKVVSKDLITNQNEKIKQVPSHIESLSKQKTIIGYIFAFLLIMTLILKVIHSRSKKRKARER